MVMGLGKTGKIVAWLAAVLTAGLGAYVVVLGLAAPPPVNLGPAITVEQGTAPGSASPSSARPAPSAKPTQAPPAPSSRPSATPKPTITPKPSPKPAPIPSKSAPVKPLPPSGANDDGGDDDDEDDFDDEEPDDDDD